MSISMLPHFQALMNLCSTALLIAGFYFIKKDKELYKLRHMKCMLGALGTSVLFTISYLTYHHYAGTTKFAGEGWIRPVYFFILFTHTVLAAAALPMIGTTLYRAFKENFEGHRKIARWTLAIWLYISITGVTIYAFLYHIFSRG